MSLSVWRLCCSQIRWPELTETRWKLCSWALIVVALFSCVLAIGVPPASKWPVLLRQVGTTCRGKLDVFQYLESGILVTVIFAPQRVHSIRCLYESTMSYPYLDDRLGVYGCIISKSSSYFCSVMLSWACPLDRTARKKKEVLATSEPFNEKHRNRTWDQCEWSQSEKNLKRLDGVSRLF